MPQLHVGKSVKPLRHLQSEISSVQDPKTIRASKRSLHFTQYFRDCPDKHLNLFRTCARLGYVEAVTVEEGPQRSRTAQFPASGLEGGLSSYLSTGKDMPVIKGCILNQTSH